MGVKSTFGGQIAGLTEPFGRVMVAAGVRPNFITTMGLVGTFGAALLIVMGAPTRGGWVLVGASLMDTLDGATARASGEASAFGAFWDSVVDRMSDGIILGAVAWFVRDRPLEFALVMTALVAALVTSYIRARAESIDLRCDKGVLERAERLVILMFALVFHDLLLWPLLAVLAVGGVITVVQRIHHVWCQVDRDLPEELLEALQGQRVWHRAFIRSARRFYGPQNFDSSWLEHHNEPVPDKVLEKRLSEIAAERAAARQERREARLERKNGADGRDDS